MLPSKTFVVEDKGLLFNADRVHTNITDVFTTQSFEGPENI